MTNTARTIWPHLRSDERSEQQQRPQTLSAAMYPGLSPEAKAWDEFRERDRAQLLQGLRDLNARLGSR
jgi:hypothetical protein